MSDTTKEEIKAAVIEALESSHATMTDDRIRGIVRDTAGEIMRGIGVDPDDGHELAADLRRVREWRIATDQIKSMTLKAAIGVLAAGTLSAVWLGLKVLVHATPK